MERRQIARTVVMVGLLAGVFLATGLIFEAGGSRSAGSAPKPPSTLSIVPSPPPFVTMTATAAPTRGSGGMGTTEPDAGEGTEGGGVTQPQEPLPPLQEPELTPAETPAAVTPTLPPGPPTLEPPMPGPPTPVPFEPGPVYQIPFVTEALPAPDATGVSLASTIKVVFSQPMDTASAESAFSVHPPVSGSFAWDAEARAMTFSPDDSFEYGTLVEWGVAKSAMDALGLELAADFEAAFRVLRQKTITLYSDPENDGHVFAPAVAALDKVVIDGDNGHNALFAGSWMRGFISFDLAGLPADTVAITGAELNIHQRAHHAQAYSAETGALWVSSLPYGDLDVGDYATATPVICPNLCYPLALELSDNAADGWKSLDVTVLVARDWKAANGDIQGLAPAGAEKLSQFRLQFLDENQGAGPDVWAEFHSGEAGGSGPKLLVTFVYP